MAQIRLRIELNQGRIGAPLDKLADVARQLDKFLRSLATDLRVDVKKGEWLAVNFENGSVKWDAALQADVSESAFRRFNDTVEFIADYDPESEGANGLVTDATLLEYGRIGSFIDTDEVISLGLYSSPQSRKPKKWRQISYRKAARVRQAMETPIESYGSVQGIMHSLVKEGATPHFQLRELATDALVRCVYRPNLYDDVVEALKDKIAVVFVTGAIKFDRVKQQIDELKVERLDRFGRVSKEELQSFFGAAPGLTGSMTTSEYIGRIRGDG